MGVQEFLKWLWLSGGSIIAASWIFERINWFKSQTPGAKEGFFFGLASLFSVGAYAAITYIPIATLDAIQPYFLIISGIFITVVIGKMFHVADKNVTNVTVVPPEKPVVVPPVAATLPEVKAP